MKKFLAYAFLFLGVASGVCAQLVDLEKYEKVEETFYTGSKSVQAFGYNISEQDLDCLLNVKNCPIRWNDEYHLQHADTRHLGQIKADDSDTLAKSALYNCMLLLTANRKMFDHFLVLVMTDGEYHIMSFASFSYAREQIKKTYGTE